MTGVHNDHEREQSPRDSAEHGRARPMRGRKGAQSKVSGHVAAPVPPPADVQSEGHEIDLGCWSPRLA